MNGFINVKIEDMEIKKILFCDNDLWSLLNFRGHVFTRLYQNGYSVALVAPRPNNDMVLSKIPDGVKYYPIDIDRCGKSVYNDLKYMRQLYRIYKQERPDYIFHYTIKPNIYGTIAAKSLGIPCTNMVAGLGYVFNDGGILSKLIIALYRFSMRKADKVMCLNSENRDTLLRKGFCKSENMILLEGGEGVDTSLFHSDVVPISDSGETVFLFVGRLLVDKGVRILVDAVRLLKQQNTYNFKCCAIGPIDLSYPGHVGAEEVKRYEEQGIMEYWGQTDCISKVLNQSNIVVVIPSYYFEGMNRSLMEACAMGKPIITTDIAGCRELVDSGKNGFTVPPRDPEALADAMKKYLQLTTEQKREFSVHSREKAERVFDINKVFTVYDKILEEASK